MAEEFPELGGWKDVGCGCPRCGVNRENYRILVMGRRWKAASETLTLSEDLCRRRHEILDGLHKAAGTVAMKMLTGRETTDAELEELAADIRVVADRYEKLIERAEAWVNTPANRALSDQRITLRDDLDVRTLQLDLRRKRAHRLGSWTEEMEAAHEAAHDAIDAVDELPDYGGHLYNERKIAVMVVEVEKAEKQYTAWGI